MKKLKILVSAHACGPNMGSEPGMGWNFVSELGKIHELHVITEKKRWEAPIKAFLKENPELCKNLHFYFIGKVRKDELRKIWPPSYYWFYRQWQKKAYKLALTLDKKENFDVVHQLNMVGYREPGYLWKMDKPFLWGPIGGFENSPWQFLPSLGFRGMLFLAARNVINRMQYHFPRPKRAIRNIRGAVVVATPNDAKIIKKLWQKEAEVIAEVGQENSISMVSGKRLPEEPLRIVWSGQHIPLKNLPFLFKAVKNIEIPYEVHILGHGEMTQKWQKLAKNLKVDGQCFWYGWQEREKALKIMANGHVLCLTSIKDLTTTVVMEALSLGIPVVCLDHMGYSHVVTEHCGVKIGVTTPSKAGRAMGDALEMLYHNEPLRQHLGRGALERAAEFSWDKKIERLNGIYSLLIKSLI